MLRLLSSAITLSCVVAFSANHHNQLRCNGKPTSTTLEAKSSTSRRQLLQNAAAASLLANPTLANAIGAYQAEAGFDDFSNGLTMPKYNVDGAAPTLSSGAGPQGKEVDPAKLEKLRARTEADKAKAAAKAEAAARARAEAERREAAQMEANAAKIRAKEEQRKRQLENMSEAQRAKIEAYEAQKADKSKQPSAVDNMKRMYSL